MAKLNLISFVNNLELDAGLFRQTGSNVEVRWMSWKENYFFKGKKEKI